MDNEKKRGNGSAGQKKNGSSPFCFILSFAFTHFKSFIFHSKSWGREKWPFTLIRHVNGVFRKRFSDRNWRKHLKLTRRQFVTENDYITPDTHVISVTELPSIKHKFNITGVDIVVFSITNSSVIVDCSDTYSSHTILAWHSWLSTLWFESLCTTLVTPRMKINRKWIDSFRLVTSSTPAKVIFSDWGRVQPSVRTEHATLKCQWFDSQPARAYI